MGDFVKINITNSQNNDVYFERKFPRDMKIGALKGKLEFITGGSAGTMQLQLYDGDKLLTKLDDEDAQLASFPIKDDMRIHVIDNFQQFFGNENVEKFELSEKQYDERPNTVRDFLKSHKLGKYNKEEMKALEERKKQEQLEEEQKAESIKIGDRCMVTAKGPRRVGTIRYKGTFHLKPGISIGVEYDEPLGMNDGSIDGHKYFQCKPKYGSMVPIMSVEIGDFPPENDGLDDDEI